MDHPSAADAVQENSNPILSFAVASRDLWDEDFVFEDAEADKPRADAPSGVIEDVFGGFKDEEDDDDDDMVLRKHKVVMFDLGHDLDESDESSEKSAEEEDEEQENWDAELGLEKQGSSNGGSGQHTQLTSIDFKSLLRQPAPQASTPRESLLEYLESSITNEFVNPLWRDIPKPPVPFTSMYRHVQDENVKESSASESPQDVRFPSSVDTPQGFLGWVNNLATKLDNVKHEIRNPIPEVLELLPNLEKLVASCEKLAMVDRYGECVRILEPVVHIFRKCCNYKGQHNFSRSVFPTTPTVGLHVWRELLQRIVNICTHSARSLLNTHLVKLQTQNESRSPRRSPVPQNRNGNTLKPPAHDGIAFDKFHDNLPPSPTHSVRSPSFLAREQTSDESLEASVGSILRCMRLAIGMFEVAIHLQLIFPHAWAKASLIQDVPEALDSLLEQLERIPNIPEQFKKLYDEVCALCVIDWLLWRCSLSPLTGEERSSDVIPEIDFVGAENPTLELLGENRRLTLFASKAASADEDLEALDDGSLSSSRKTLQSDSDVNFQSALLPAQPLCTLLELFSRMPRTIVRAKLSFACLQYLVLLWQRDVEEFDEEDLERFQDASENADDVKIMESMLFQSVIDVFAGEDDDTWTFDLRRWPPTKLAIDAGADEVPFLTSLAYSTLRAFADAQIKTKPLYALVMLEVCIILLHKQQRFEEKRTLEKEVAILSAHHRDVERAIQHCTSVLKGAEKLHDVNEVVFVADLLVSQFCDQGSLERAVQVLRNTLEYLDTVQEKSEGTARQLQCQICADPLRVRLAQVLLLGGTPELSVKELRLLYLSLNARSDSTANLMKKISVLSWLAKSHLKMRDFDGCKKAIHLIKTVRSNQLNAPKQRSKKGTRATLLTNAMWWGYRADAMDPCLPKFCLTTNNYDLGELTARMYYHSKSYVAALKSLVPVTTCVELAVGIKPDNHSSISQLGRLYYLRGKVHLCACRNSSCTRFPFAIGSRKEFHAILEAFEAESSENDLFLHSNDKEDVKTRKILSSVTCRRAKRYLAAADLLWDALKWFRRAWDCFQKADDSVRAAKAAMYIAKTHLQALFVPVCIMHAPFEVACNLKRPQSYHALDSEQMSYSQTPTDLRTPNQKIASSESKEGKNRSASVDVAKQAMEYVTHITKETCLPFLALDAYLNLAEISMLQNENTDSVTYWWEARDLFLQLFVDCTQIPLLRRAPLSTVEKLNAILCRLVRFLWACPKTIVNQNLFLLDLYVLNTIEFDRAIKVSQRRARIVTWQLQQLSHLPTVDKAKKNISRPVVDTPRSPAATQRIPKASSDDISLQFDDRDVGICDNENYSVLEGLFYFKNPLLRTNSAQKVHLTPGHGQIGLSIDLDASTYSKDLEDKSLVRRALDSDSDLATAEIRVNPSRRTKTSNSENIVEGLCTSPSSTDRLDESLDDGFDSQTPTRRNSIVLTVDDVEEQLSHQFPWMVIEDGTTDLEARLVQNSWRCLYLLDRSCKSFSSSNIKINNLRDKNRQTLRLLHMTMNRLRKLTGQYAASEISYEAMTGKARAAMGTAEGVELKRPLMLISRLRKLVYALQIEDLALMYRPESGAFHAQHLGGSGLVVFNEQPVRSNGGNPPTHSRNPSALSNESLAGMGEDEKEASALPCSSTSILKGMESEISRPRSQHSRSQSHGDDEESDGSRGGSYPALKVQVPPLPRSLRSDVPYTSGLLKHSWGPLASLHASELPVELCRLMFEMAVETEDSKCAGGNQERGATLNKMRTQALAEISAFLRLVCVDEEIKNTQTNYDISPAVSPSHRRSLEHETTSPGEDVRSSTHKRALSNSAKGKQRGGFFSLFKSRTSSVMPPSVDSPVVMVCSKCVQVLPWENLVPPNTPVVRALCLMSLYTGAIGTGICGPELNMQPEYLGVAQGLQTLPSKLSNDLKHRETMQRASNIITTLVQLHHDVSFISPEQKKQMLPQGPIPRMQVPVDIAIVYSRVQEQYRDNVWPFPSPLTLYGRNTANPRSNRLKQYTYFDLTKIHDTSQTSSVNALATSSSIALNSSGGSGGGMVDAPTVEARLPISPPLGPCASLLRWIDNQVVPDHTFPLVMFTYSDLDVLGDVCVHLLASRSDAIVVFAPHFCAGVVAKEIITAIGMWCSGDHDVGSFVRKGSSDRLSPQHNSQPAQQDADLNVNDDVLFEEPESPPPNHSHRRGLFSLASSEAKEVLKTRTWVYHALMDACLKVQQQCASPVVVFNV